MTNCLPEFQQRQFPLLDKMRDRLGTGPNDAQAAVKEVMLIRGEADEALHQVSCFKALVLLAQNNIQGAHPLCLSHIILLVCYCWHQCVSHMALQ